MNGEYGVRAANGDWVEFRIGEERALSLFENHRDAYELIGGISTPFNPDTWEVILSREEADGARAA